MKNSVYQKDITSTINKSEKAKQSSQKRIDSFCGEYENRVNYLEQQIESMKTTHTLSLVAKNVEIDSLKRQIRTLELSRNI